MRDGAETLLRSVRRAAANVLAAASDRSLLIEGASIAVGRRGSARSMLVEGAYRTFQDALVARWRASERRYRDVTIQGQRLVVDVSDATGRLPFFAGTPYEPAVTDAILAALRSGDVFIDVGANIGYFSIVAALRVGPGGRAIAFEPHDGARARLGELVRRNGVDAVVEIVPAAISDHEERVALYATDEFSSYSTLDPALSPMREVVTFRESGSVRAVTLDGWLASRPELIERVRCIKIDVEGHESRAVRGMASALQSPSVTVICETRIGSDADVALEAAGLVRERIESTASSYGNFRYARRAAKSSR